MIHVCFSLYDKTGRYSKFTGTAMLSLFENTSSEVTVHILHDDTLTNENRDKFLELTNRYNQNLKFYNVEELCADKLNKYVELVPQVKNARVIKGAFFKFLIHEVLDKNIEKVIYLDSDIIVNLDINELWQINLGDHPIAAVLEKDNNTPISRYSDICRDGVVKEENYFNSGVLLMDLNIFREKDNEILSGIQFTSEHSRRSLADQDVLNYCFSTSFLKLHVKFNKIIKESRNQGVFSTIREIYHYAGGRVGLGLDMSDPFNRLWWSYFIRTPWFGVDTLDSIFKGATDSMLRPSDMSSGKVRLFIVDEEHAYQIERNFSVREEEEIIIVDIEDKDSVKKIVDLINSSRGKNEIFIGLPLSSKLGLMDIYEGKDFFDVSSFYSPVWGILQKNYDLILSM